MQIVIDIPDHLYNVIKNKECTNKNVLTKAVENGIPLPKGHGRLIDADELKEHKYRDNDRYENAVAAAQIDWADTIIEAERAESEVEE